MLRLLQRCLWASAVLYLIFQPPLTGAATGRLDAEIGAEGALAVRAQMGLYDNPALVGYVTSVGNRLTSALSDNRFTFRFQVVDDAIPNAFALPGGYIYVTRGLLTLLQTEDELAGVLAHEIIHVSERHGVVRSRRGLLGGLLEVPGRIVGGLVDESVGQLINAPITGARRLIMANYSRGQEREADKKGIRIVALAGYDPTHLSPILQRLAQTVEMVTKQAEQQSLLRNHPITADRMAYLAKAAPKLKRGAAQRNVADLFSKLDGLTFGQNPDSGIFLQDTFLHPRLDLALVFPKGWSTFNYPITVGAISPDQTTALLYSFENSSQTPAALGKSFAANLPAEYRNKIDRMEAITVNGISSFVVTIIESPTRAEKIYLHMAWAKFDGFTLRLAAYGNESAQETLKTSARNFRRLSNIDRNAIESRQIAIAMPNPGETLSSFSDRVDNRWSEELTRVINDIDAPGLEPRRLKILKVGPYFDD